ncbi:SDR family NAD(P)-dependent oxidoreductase [Metabacillus litoralis]|uniref:SDR family NAD(P)-dependent oxidoreductase n=1 Tax=Metabacillus litoralis TaxID=152268 RepID=UPI00203C58F0|nr:3-oxoacyl-ACP reductase FabG [Metabacillus litoralis]MCM3653334.1 3-oxoacyl-ACP reductase FabG [Metabacillus litoralis]
MGRLDGRIAIVTGGAQGIGAATVKAFSIDRAKVAIFDQNQAKMEELIQEIRAQGGECLAFQCDITKRDEVEQSVQEVVRHFGKVDILVNNAGVTRDNLLFKMTDEDFDTVINTHLKGSFICSREVQKYMVKQGNGKIVMLSSRSALGKRGQTNYAAAKAGIQGMTKTMAIELGTFGINVNAVAPGFIETQMTKDIAERTGIPYEKIKQDAIQSQAIKRVGKPEEVANLITFLSSNESDYITGQVIYVAGNVTN